MSKIFPDFSFHLKDISSEPLEDIFDVILLNVWSLLENETNTDSRKISTIPSLECFSGWTSCSQKCKTALYVRPDNRGSEKIFTEDKLGLRTDQVPNGTLHSIRKLGNDSDDSTLR